ncbi:aldo/keto reductase family protein [Sulfurospirillum barnesii]|uniref:Aldo/keto reductase, diketogulonate reductase n=1 Tax=Sulfurospirillum barnesii (strain ATCC 700032 / DSM 10660 / SES-3) TaxID=760154 RepID=I3XYW8_SULBS|nr:aldo/keto reductase [Sulfurospirillum barnesii]AFL69142.1 aldo/keto reductase, diketogulonate reductase [Sulfurospirillum barnesii SES-3]
MQDILLTSGNTMPIFGLGTADPMHDVKPPKWVKGRWTNALYHRTLFRFLWIMRGFKMAFLIKNAIKSGYRMIDTSSTYRNGFYISLGIKMSKIKREDLFIITRISNKEQWNSSVRESVDKSLRELNIDYIDLFMFHWPVSDQFLDTWKQMEEVYKEGLVKSIGVANCHEHHLEDILKIATVIPSVNEFEIHPLMTQKKLVQFCKSKDIVPMAYTPIGRVHPKIVKNQDLIAIAKKYNKSVPQIVLRWHTQKGIPAIPRSMNKTNIEKNIDIFNFELDKSEIMRIDDIDENMRLRYDPDNCDFTKL